MKIILWPPCLSVCCGPCPSIGVWRRRAVPSSLQWGPMSTVLLLLPSRASEWGLCLGVLGDMRGCVGTASGTGLPHRQRPLCLIPSGLLPLSPHPLPLATLFPSSHTSLSAVSHMPSPLHLCTCPSVRFLPQISSWLMLSLALGLISSVDIPIPPSTKLLFPQISFLSFLFSMA